MTLAIGVIYEWQISLGVMYIEPTEKPGVIQIEKSQVK